MERFKVPMGDGLLHVTLDSSSSAQQFEDFPAVVAYLDTGANFA